MTKKTEQKKPEAGNLKEVPAVEYFKRVEYFKSITAMDMLQKAHDVELQIVNILENSKLPPILGIGVLDLIKMQVHQKTLEKQRADKIKSLMGMLNFNLRGR